MCVYVPLIISYVLFIFYLSFLSVNVYVTIEECMVIILTRMDFDISFEFSLKRQHCRGVP